mmetsp:Transcript_26595/g.88184  ORF Transcript_26595/g.88184 Transcript_26595/m.88184 type:complete len:208 (+) Transcript_26595:552-1175(+)
MPLQTSLRWPPEVLLWPPMTRTVPSAKATAPWSRRGPHGASSATRSQDAPPSPERQMSARGPVAASPPSISRTSAAPPSPPPAADAGTATRQGDRRAAQGPPSAIGSQLAPPSSERHTSSSSTSPPATPPRTSTVADVDSPPVPTNVVQPAHARSGQGAASRTCSQVLPPSMDRQTSFSGSFDAPWPPNRSTGPPGRAARQQPVRAG